MALSLRLSLLVLLCGVIAAVSASQEDALALSLLYNATGGPRWTNQVGWFETSDPCEKTLSGGPPPSLLESEISFPTLLSREEGAGHLVYMHTHALKEGGDRRASAEAEPLYPTSWRGISCGVNSKRVALINLKQNNLRGELPDEMFQHLPKLQGLKVASNHLSGELPPSLWLCNATIILDFSGNQLSGGLPSSWSSLRLVQLLAPQNQLTGSIPESWSQMPLEVLSLYSNRLSGQVAELFADMPLTTLALSDNEFSGALPLVSDSIRLYALSVCDFSGLVPPSLLTDKPNLEAFDVSMNADLFAGRLPDDIATYSGLYLFMMDHVPAITSLDLFLHTPLLRSFALYGPAVTANCSLTELIGACPLTFIRLQQTSVSSALPSTGYNRAMLVLDLQGTPVTGDIPDLSAMPLLEYVDLGQTRVGGTIPASICELRLLTVFSAGAHSAELPTLHGSIPSCAWPPRLDTLSLVNTAVQGAIPASLFDLEHLRVLRTDWCRISHIEWPPEDDPPRKALRAISMAVNQLNGTLPTSIGALFPSLRWLAMPMNGLSGTIPASLCGMHDLELLSLAGNPLSGSVPPCFEEMRSLDSFNVADCGLAGEVRLPPMAQIVLSDNAFDGGIEGLCARNLVINRSGLGGDLATLCGCARLETLEAVEFHPDPPELPDCMGSLPRLAYLDMDQSGLTGTIPRSFGNLTSLQTFTLVSNQVEGQLPDELGQLLNLEDLKLNSNRLSGTLPASLGQLQQLLYLQLAENEIEGTLPPEWAGLTSLAELLLTSNRLSGTIPIEWNAMEQLRDLELGTNRLSGSIPSLGGMRSLMVLNVGGNELTGCLPASFGFMPLLGILYVNDNALSCVEIPEEHVLSNLEGFSAASNQLTEVPLFITSYASTSRLTQLHSLSLFNNAIQGTLPSSIALLRELVALDFASNRFEGSLDVFVELDNHVEQEWMGSSVWDPLTSLNEVVLSDNLFTGTIPQSLALHQDLSILDLSQNRLSGSIPATLFWGRGLYAMRLNNNAFEGAVPDLHTLPSQELRLVDFSNNPELRAPEGALLPNWIEPTPPQEDQSNYNFFEGNFYCPKLSVVGHPSSSVVLSAAYYGYRQLCLCGSGFSGQPPDGCEPCPAHMTCVADLSDPLEPVSLVAYPKGYFPVVSGEVLVGVEECARYDLDHSACNPEGSCAFENRHLAETCAFCEEGYTGHLCSQCVWDDDNGHYFRSDLGECHPCTTPSSLAFLSAVFFLLALAVVCIVLTVWKKKELLLVIELLMLMLLVILGIGEWWMLDLVIIFMIMQSVATHELSDGAFKGLVFFLQTTNTITPSMWPNALLHIGYVLQFTGLQLSGTSCVLGTDNIVVLFIADMLTPVVLIVVMYLVFLSLSTARALADRIRGHASSDASPGQDSTASPSLLSRLVTWPLAKTFFASLLILNASYFELAVKILDTFRCEEDPLLDLPYSELYPWMLCGENNELRTVKLLAMFFGIVYIIGIPVLLFVIVFRIRARHRREFKEVEALRPSLNAPEAVLSEDSLLVSRFMGREQEAEEGPMYGFLCECYEPQVYWWEAVWVARRLMLALASSLIPNESSWRVSMLQLLLVCFFASTALVKPFKHLTENLLDLCGLGLIMVNLSAVASEEFAEAEVLSWTLACATLLLTAVFLLYLMYGTYTRLIHRVLGVFRRLPCLAREE